jgi:K+-sensing histidine kinase KdpD
MQRVDEWLDGQGRVALGGLLPLVASGALVFVRPVVAASTVAMILVTVVALAATLSRPAGVAAALTATLSFDFAFTHPYGTLRIASADDVETAIVLLVAGLTIGTVGQLRRDAARAAEQSRSEIGRIHRVAELSARGEDWPDVLLACEAELLGLLELRDCRFVAGLHDTTLPRLERTGALSGVSEYRFAAGDFELPRQGVVLPVMARGQEIGAFQLEPTPGVGVSIEQRVVAVALADQVGAALGHHRPPHITNGGLG